MECKAHADQVSAYICNAPSCEGLTLCKKCYVTHLSKFHDTKAEHSTHIIPIKKAYEQALENMNKSRKKIENILYPFETEKSVEQEIQRQKEELRKEKIRINRIVDELIDTQINRLNQRNLSEQIRSEETIDKLSKKLEEIVTLQKEFKNSSKSLKKALDYDIETYLNKISKQDTGLTSLSKNKPANYYIYPTTVHDFFISKLQLKPKNVEGRLLKKNANVSPLYFLIGDNMTTTPLLHYFSTRQKLIRVYNVGTEKWQIFNSPYDIPLFSCNVHDPKSNKFFCIGGKAEYGSSRSKQIVWYDIQAERWEEASLQTPRSSAMCVIVKDKIEHNKVLIVGGLNSKNEPIKSCQILDPEAKTTELFGETIFGTSSGTLVNFNDNIIFKIGGLSNHGSGQVICQNVEKIDYGKERYTGNPKWSYVEFEDVEAESAYQLLYAHQAAIQINPNEIFVFGGSNHNNKGVNESYLIEIEQYRKKNFKGEMIESNRYYVRWINEKPLISREDFKGLQPILWNKKLYSLQNISEGNQIFEKEKKLIEFDMFTWFEIENIVTV